MRFSHLIFSLAALGLAMVRPVYAEETVSGPLYIVVYFEVDDRAGLRSLRPGATRRPPRRMARPRPQRHSGKSCRPR